MFILLQDDLLRPTSHTICYAQYCDKKDIAKKNIFEPQVFFGPGKLLAQSMLHFYELTLVFKSLPWMAVGL